MGALSLDRLRGSRRVAIAAVTAAALVFLVDAIPQRANAAEEPIASVDYACKDEKTIKAAYYSDKVDLVLSDGRSLTLPQSLSGSGTRYADADESVVFWSKGANAFVTEGAEEEETYTECTEQP